MMGMKHVIRFTFQSVLLGAAVMTAAGAKCKDPPQPTIGGVVLAIRTFPADDVPDLQSIHQINIEQLRIDVVYSATLDGEQEILTIDDTDRQIELPNAGEDLIVTKLAVNTGFVHQIRLYPGAVQVGLVDTTTINLEEGPNLPSWHQSGWKVVPQDGKPWEVIDDELIGVRGLFDFDDRVLHSEGLGYKIKPTIPAEEFAVNPPEGAPGVFFDQLTVVFKPDVSTEKIDEIISTFGYTIIAPKYSYAYRIKVPPEKNVDEAAAFFAQSPEVQGGAAGDELRAL